MCSRLKPIFKRVTPVYVDWSEMGERRTDHQKYFVRSNGVDWSETKCHSSVHLTSTDFAETREYCSEHTCADFGEVACENSHWLSHNSSVKIWMRCWAKSARNIKTAARHAQLATVTQQWEPPRDRNTSEQNFRIGHLLGYLHCSCRGPRRTYASWNTGQKDHVTASQHSRDPGSSSNVDSILR